MAKSEQSEKEKKTSSNPVIDFGKAIAIVCGDFKERYAVYEYLMLTREDAVEDHAASNIHQCLCVVFDDDYFFFAEFSEIEKLKFPKVDFSVWSKVTGKKADYTVRELLGDGIQLTVDESGAYFRKEDVQLHLSFEELYKAKALAQQFEEQTILAASR